MAVIQITGVEELQRRLDLLTGPLLTTALRNGLKEVRADAMRVWKLATPKRTGATRASYGARAIVRGAVRTSVYRAELDFYVRPPADAWYAGVDRRHKMTAAMIRRLRRRAGPILSKHVRRAFQQVGGQ